MKNYTFTYEFKGQEISTATFSTYTKKDAKQLALRHKRMDIARESGKPSNKISTK